MTQTLELSIRIRQLEQQAAALPSLESDLVRLTSEIQDAHAACDTLEKVNQALEGNVLVLVPEPPIDIGSLPAVILPAPADPPAPLPAAAPEPEPAPKTPAAPETPTPVPTPAGFVEQPSTYSSRPALGAEMGNPITEAQPATRPALSPEADVLRYFAINPSESLARAVAAALPHLSTTTVNATLKSLAESGQLERSGAGGNVSPYWYSAKSAGNAPSKPSPAPEPAPRTERVTHQANLPRDIPPLSSKSAVASLEEQARILEVLKGTTNGLSSSLLSSKLNKDKAIRFDVLIANLEALKDGGKVQVQEGKWQLK